MIRAIFAFILLLCSIILGIEISKGSGVVLISMNHWIIETTLWVAAAALILMFISIHLFLQLCHKLAKAPSKIRQWHSLRLAQKAQAITRKGLIEYSEGYWKQAKNHLIQGLPGTDAPLLNYLTAARAAQKMGDNKQRDHYLREAQYYMPDAKIAVALTQAQLQLANSQWEQALATLMHLHDLAPHHPYVLKLLMNLYEEVKDWPQLLSLLPKLKKFQVISKSDYDQLEQKAYVQRMIDMEKQNQFKAIKDLFNTLPKSLAHNPTILIQYVQSLLKRNEYTEAESLLNRSLRKEFNPQLIELYGLFICKDQQLSFAESLLKKNGQSSALYLCLGRLCIAQQLWGKAKHYLEQALKLHPSPMAYAELGDLYEKLNDSLKACENYRKGLYLTVNLSRAS